MAMAAARTAARTNKTVIDEALIRAAVLEERVAEREAAGVGGLMDEEEMKVDFPEVASLILSFKSIVRIQNLQGFESLTRLQLDNNNIERIEGLSHLVQLQWLDLSFNKISYIEGLDQLAQLADLSLFHNNISVCALFSSVLLRVCLCLCVVFLCDGCVFPCVNPASPFGHPRFHSSLRLWHGWERRGTRFTETRKFGRIDQPACPVSGTQSNKCIGRHSEAQTGTYCLCFGSDLRACLVCLSVLTPSCTNI